MNGWIKLHRKFSEWEWADEPNMVSFFIHLLVSASNRDSRWKGVELKRGQVIFGRQKWSEKTGISEQGIRTCIKKLKSTNEITTKTTSKFTIITIVNYNEYQSSNKEEQPANQPADQPASNQQPTIKQPHRVKVKNEEDIKEIMKWESSNNGILTEDEPLF